jgi:glycosyltransferase involved in cell wall biosynthesis
MIQNDVKITFIIPTIGRDTLQNTIDCLLNQTDPKWKAIIVFDGILPNITNDDERIKIVTCPKVGEKNSGGLVRNYGINLADTEWIAFVDDDDGIKNTYVEIFLDEITHYCNNDLIIFRMIYPDNVLLLPPVDTDNFYFCKVGISFVVKKKIFDSGLIFVPGQFEDYTFLDKVREQKYKIMISRYLLYFVRNYNTENNTISNRVFINY